MFVSQSEHGGKKDANAPTKYKSIAKAKTPVESSAKSKGKAKAATLADQVAE